MIHSRKPRKLRFSSEIEYTIYSSVNFSLPYRIYNQLILMFFLVFVFSSAFFLELNRVKPNFSSAFSFWTELLDYIGGVCIYLEIWLVALYAFCRFSSWLCPVYWMVPYLLSSCIIDSEFPWQGNYLDSTISSKWELLKWILSNF